MADWNNIRNSCFVRRIRNWSFASIAYSVVPFTGQILLSIVFLVSGAEKLVMPDATTASIESAGLPLPPLAFAMAASVEIVGGLALIAGYQTRPVAAMLVLFTLATAAVFHTNFADHNQLFHLLKNVALAGGLLQVVAFGAPRLSIDARGT